MMGSQSVDKLFCFLFCKEIVIKRKRKKEKKRKEKRNPYFINKTNKTNNENNNDARFPPFFF
jgi:hypothetical protein